MALGTLDQRGYSEELDFLHLPFDRRTASGKGYAFLNFRTNRAAEVFSRDFDGFRFGRGGKGKVSHTATASIQGLEANIRKFCRMRKAPQPTNCALPILRGEEAQYLLALVDEELRGRQVREGRQSLSSMNAKVRYRGGGGSTGLFLVGRQSKPFDLRGE